MTHTVIHSIELFVYVALVILFIGISIPYALIGNGLSVRKVYEEMPHRPAFAPRPWLFAVAWSVLFLLEAAAFTVVRLRGEWIRGFNMAALIVFAVMQLVLAMWTPLFLYSLAWGAILVFVALGFAIATTWLFFDISNAAGWLMIPLVAWLVFAFILAVAFWWLNRKVDMVERCQRGIVKITP